MVAGNFKCFALLSYKVVYKIWGRIVQETPTGRLSHSLGALNSQPWSGGNCCFAVRLSAGRWVGSPLHIGTNGFFSVTEKVDVSPHPHDIFIFHQSFWSITMEHQMKTFWSDFFKTEVWQHWLCEKPIRTLVKNIPKSFLDWVSNK